MIQQAETHQRLFLATLTPRNAPPRGLISHWERTGPHVLPGDDDEGLLLCGPLGVNYYIERADADVLYLRRWDVPESPSVPVA